MKIVLPGGTGQVGHILARAFRAGGHDVVVLSRREQHSSYARVLPWDARTVGAWQSEIDGSDAVINLAGRSVNCRYTPENRRLILDSRVESTRAVGQAIAACKKPPRVWLQMSTATIYAHRYDAPNDEFTGIIGGEEPSAPDTWRFSIEVAKAWEQACTKSATQHTRQVLLRTAMVMSPERNGVFDTLLTLVRRGIGGQAGDGKQYLSWIHGEDFIRGVMWVLEHEELSGPVNIAAPNPLPNAEFMRALRRVWGARLGLPATSWMIEVVTRLMGTESELILKSRRVVPARLTQTGFGFAFPEWPAAALDLCRKVRTAEAGNGKNGG